MKKSIFTILLIAISMMGQIPLSFANDKATEEKGAAGQESNEKAAESQNTPIIIPIGSFVAKRQISNMQISPNGKSVLFTLLKGEEQYLLVADLTKDGLKVSNALFKNKDIYVSSPRWATDKRIIYTLNFQTRVKRTKYKLWSRMLYAIDRDAKNLIALRTDGRTGTKSLKHIDSADLINILPEDPAHILVGKSRNKNWVQDYYKGVISDVYMLNINTGEMELYMRAPKIRRVRLHDWYSDHSGHIRFGYGKDRKGNSVMLIRGKNEEDWQQLNKNELFEEGKFSPLQFGSKPNEFYVLSAMATGRNTVFKFDIASGELDGKIFEHDKVDVSNIIYSYKKQKVLAAIYYDENRELAFFDDDYKKMRMTIKKALGTDVFIQSQSKDEKNMILLAKDDTHPGTYYHYDVARRHINYLAKEMKAIYPEEIAPMEGITYETRDGISISGYITLPLNYAGEPLPTIVLPHQNPQSRDYKDWNYTAKYLANRGYIVIQPNYRGSTGYGHRFQSLGDGEWGGDMQNDLADAARWAIKKGYSHPDKICIMGKSYAGYAALMGVATDPDLFKCAISWGGVSDIKQMFKDDRALDTDGAYYQRVAGDAEKSELQKISPISYVKNISGAVLMVHGEDDDYHKVKQSKNFAKKLNKAGKVFDYYEMKDAGHSLNTTERKQLFLEIVENFLAEVNPTDILRGLKKEGKLAKKPTMTLSNR